jgi:hypothetical protein
LLWLGDKPAFELTFWCGTCSIAFQRLEGANGTLSVVELEDVLGEGLARIDPAVLSAFGETLPRGPYLPLLLKIAPKLVYPGQPSDYFAHEQIHTWGIDGFWGLPDSPRTPYYRTFETAVDDDAHLYEFVVPMVPPNWNNPDRTAAHATRLATTSQPTAVAVSTLDISQPAMDSQSTDYYAHWALTHFLLDGHHKMEAAARTGRELQLLALVSVEASLAQTADVERLPDLLARPTVSRPGG